MAENDYGALFDPDEWIKLPSGHYQHKTRLNVHGEPQQATQAQIDELKKASQRLTANPMDWRGGAGSWLGADFYNWEDTGLGAQWAGNEEEMGRRAAALPANEQKDLLYTLMFQPATSHGGWQGMNNLQRALVLGGLAAGGAAAAGAFGGGGGAAAAGGAAGGGAAGGGSGVLSALGFPAGSTIAPGIIGGAGAAGSGIGAAAASGGGGILSRLGSALSGGGDGDGIDWGKWMPQIVGGAGDILASREQAHAAERAAQESNIANERAIDFLRESRDEQRAYQRPYYEAGTQALNQMLRMTGLNPVGSGPVAPSAEAAPAPSQGINYQEQPIKMKYGGPMYERAMGGPTYLMGEAGKEDFYHGGSYEPVNGPRMVEGKNGYVIPRQYGGPTRNVMDPSVMRLAQKEQQLLTSGPGLGKAPPEAATVPGTRGAPIKMAPTPTPTAPGARMSPMDMAGNTESPVKMPVAAAPEQAAAPAQSLPGGPTSGPPQNYDITTDPSYRWRVNESMRALETGAAAKGGLLSGGFARKALRYAQDYASTEYSNIYNRLSTIAQLGPSGGGGAGSGSTYDTQIAGLIGDIGANRGGAAFAGGTASANNLTNLTSIASGLPWEDILA